ncbi:MAG: hypothetical protein GC168_15095 [Candidatus Hydrogenedens sp.]|nr:hypothetical protein [Candidatus Hydrogenedens sp.]
MRSTRSKPGKGRPDGGGVWGLILGAVAAGILVACAVTDVAAAATVGKVKVILTPDAVVAQAARWRVDGGAWKKSGVAVGNIAPGTHTITYKSVVNWESPAATEVTVATGKTTTVSVAYTPVAASVRVILDPSPVLSEGARWKLDNGSWRVSNFKLNLITPGTHTISFRPRTGWNTPEPIEINLAAGDLQTKDAVYSLVLGQYVVLGYNDLGMHCMNQDFSELMILPPYNTIHAQVFRRGSEPRMITSGITVDYSVPGNTSSADKTNFWDYAEDLFGVSLPLDVGLTGNGLAGPMKPRKEIMDWQATGIPLTQITDAGKSNALQLAELSVKQSGTEIARTDIVVPVSWEISCNLCHEKPGVSVDTAILQAHDQMHGTNLENSKPVVCGSCHAQPPLGLAGQPGVASLSSAMHSAHAARMDQVTLANSCYACHPGVETQCLRDVHVAKGMTCVDCHGSMAEVGNPARQSWVDEPKCGDCHQRSHFTFEEPGKLYRESRGHHEVQCATCHGSPHAITPATTKPDNVQSQMVQGHSGVLDCAVCHINKPRDEFEHHL